MRALGVRSLSKAFDGRPALTDVTFAVATGEIVALVGENGAGKSTLLRTLAGFVAPDAGTVEIDHEPVHLRGPRDAAARGVGLVHQQHLLIDALTVAENVVLGREPGAGPLLDRVAAVEEVRACAQRFGLDVDPRARVGELGVAARQRVELLKVLVRGARYVLLDEPTALLPPDDVRALFALMRRLAGEGCGVVLVTHRLREVLQVCSRAVVLRGGRVAGECVTSLVRVDDIARLMVGADVEQAASTPRAASPGGDVVLDVADLSVARESGGLALDGVSFALRAGEVLGVAGVAGNGQTELVEAIAGLRPSRAERLLLGGVDLGALDVAARRRAGVRHLPEDRGRDGLAPGLTVAENVVLPSERVARFAAHGWLDRAAIRDVGEEVVRAHDVRPPYPDAVAGTLSGGHQQKVLVARELHDPPKLLLAAEPARGLDFKATQAVHRRFRAVADAGGGVLLVSTDLAELLAVCDRILVLFAGRIAGEVDPARTSETELGLLLSGAKSK